MNKILLIIKREYLSRVKKKSFLLITFLVPLFLIAVYAMAIFLAVESYENNHATVQVIDQSGLFKGKLTNTDNITFQDIADDVPTARHNIREREKTFLLIIPEQVGETYQVELLSTAVANFGIQETISGQLQEVLRDIAYQKAGIDSKTVAAIRPNVTISAKEITLDGEKQSNAGAALGIAIALSMVVYICLMLYGTQVMRGVIEEKSNRIIEVIISSVKPFQLMMGKIIGIGLVGLTQFTLWIVLSATLMGGARMLLMDNEVIESVSTTQQHMPTGSVALQTTSNKTAAYSDVMQALNTIDFQAIIIGFFAYFFGGYALYSALFAAVGSAVDSETETQQFVFPHNPSAPFRLYAVVWSTGK